uniref:Uncharacterized protein n=1 Tax=Nannospalax galili TaxID=1026970 RepID=A0A8C6W1K1_NANGA
MDLSYLHQKSEPATLDCTFASRNYFSTNQELDSLNQELNLNSLIEDLCLSVPEVTTETSVCTYESHPTSEPDLLQRLSKWSSNRSTLNWKNGAKYVQELQYVQLSNAYVKEKTSTALTTMGSAICRKLEDMRKSSTFRSFEELIRTIKSGVSGGRELGSDIPPSPGSGTDSHSSPGSGNDTASGVGDQLLPVLEPE